jgi:uncharacterized membrane protein YcaP (DUF421 family)
MLRDLFLLQIPLLDKVLRSIAVYLFLVLALRLAGKRELAQLNSLDLGDVDTVTLEANGTLSVERLDRIDELMRRLDRIEARLDR